MSFLTDQFNKGASYGSLNSHRAAIGQIAGPELGSDFRVRRFFKGIYGMKPPSPRYEHVWDPHIVLTYVRKLKNNEISLEMLTKKLTVLLALSTGQRIQTLSLIKIDDISLGSNKIEIKIANRIKTSALNKPQPFLILPFFDMDPEVCVARGLIQYIEKTKDLRNSCQYLFITYKKPHHRASPQTIGRWIRDILKLSGVNIKHFKPQSTRHASTSLAAQMGVSFEAIRLAAGWSENSKTFANFYHRPIIDNTQFARAVLSGVKGHI